MKTKILFVIIFLTYSVQLISQTIYKENFEGIWENGLTNGWINPKGELKWINNNKSTNFMNYKSGDVLFNGGLFTKNYVISENFNNGISDTNIIQSPSVNLMLKTNIKLRFFHFISSPDTKLDVYFSKDAGVSWDKVQSLTQTTKWIKETIDIPLNYYTPGFMVKFEAIGNNPSSKIALDEFLIYSPNALSGTYTIQASGGSYSTFDAAIDDLNTQGISGAVTFNVAAGFSSTESPSAITTTGTSAFPIIFQKNGAGVNPVLTASGGAGSSDNGFCLNGVSYVTFDGIDVTGGNTVEYGIYIINRNISDGGSSNNTIKNCTISLDRTNTSSIGVYQNTVESPSSAAQTNSDNKYYNLTITNVYNGIILNSTSNSIKDGGNKIGILTGGSTTIGSATANDIGNGTGEVSGIKLNNQKDFEIFNSEIKNVTIAAGSSSNVYGININEASGSNKIYNNKVHNIGTLTTTISSKVFGIRADAASDGKINVYNNVIYSLTHSLSSVDANLVAFGIAANISGSGADTVLFNSVRMDLGSNVTNTAFYSGSNGNVTRNNIFANFSADGTTSERYCYFLNAGNSVGNSSNNILYYSGSTNCFTGFATEKRVGLDLFASAISPAAPTDGYEGGSSSNNPVFTSTTDLTFSGSTPARQSGTPIYSVPADINGTTRDASRPTIGAYETSQSQLDKSAPILSNVSITTNVTNPSVSITLTDNSNSSSNAVVRLWYRAAGTTDAFTGLDANLKPTGAMNGTYTWNDFSTLANGEYEFYVAARDGQGAGTGIRINPIWTTQINGFAATDPPNYLSNPDDANNVRTFKKLGALAGGTYEVGDGAPTYKTLTQVASVLNTSEIQDNVIFVLRSDYMAGSYSETYPITFKQFFSVGNNKTTTITVNSGVSSVTTTGNSATGLFILDGVDYINFDGRDLSNDNTVRWTINNTNTSAGASAVIVKNDALRDTIRYCTLIANDGSTTGSVINMGGTTGTTGNDYIGITNCNINGNGTTTNAIYSFGESGKENTAAYVSGNNIYDFFSASNNCVGININSYNTSWKVRDNKIYQTASRTFTSDKYYAGIYISYNQNSGTEVTGNSIGFANSGGTGNTTITGGSNQFFGIYASIGTFPISNFERNIISGISQTTNIASTNAGSGAFYGIYINAGNVTSDSNIIGSLDATSSITVTSSSTVSGTVPSVGICNVSASNSIISNNKIGSLTITNTSGGNALGFTAFEKSGSGVSRIDSNFIGNASNTITLNNQAGQLIGIRVTGATNSIRNNQINNLIHTAANTGTGTSASVIGIYRNTTSSGEFISSNVVHSLVNNNSTSSSEIAGIYVAGSGTVNVNNNFVHSLNSTFASTSSKHYGIALTGGNTRLYNNMIRMGIDPSGNSISSDIALFGVLKSSGDLSMFFNSIYVGGSVTAGTINTYSFQRTAAGTDSIMNNVFVNARANSTTNGGSHFAYSLNNSTVTFSDYNVFYAPNTLGRLFSLDGGTGYASTLKAFRDAVFGNDLHSGVGNPNYIAPTGNSGTVDLKISGTTPVEGAGTPLGGITADYEGNSRNATTPDIGADEGTFTFTDIYTPFISYTALPSPGGTGSSRTLSGVRIVDLGSGIETTNNPRVWYKKMWVGTWASSDAGTMTSGTVNDGTWSFNIDYTRIGNVIAGDTIYYYVTAADANSNLWYHTFDSVVNHTSTIVQSAGPEYRNSTRPYNYYIADAISGTIYVGSTVDYSASNTYTTLTADTGKALFKNLNSKLITGNITANIVSDITEPGTVALNQWTEDGGSLTGYTITIQPDGTTLRTISATGVASGVSMIRFNGSDRVTINGNSGKYLKFVNTNSTPANTGATFEFNNSDTSISLTNCIIQNNSTSSSTGAILFNSTGTNRLVTISNCDIGDATGTNTPYNSVYSSGSNNTLITISSNNIFNWTNYGINFNNSGNSNTISGNSFYQTTSISSSNTGIKFTEGSSITVSGNYIGGSTANCGGSAWTNSGAVPFAGIDLSAGTGTTNSIQGNTVSNITMSSTDGGASFAGIKAGSGTVNIGNVTPNTIGSNTTSNSISFAGNGDFIGILSSSSSTVTITSNIIANLTATGTGTGSSTKGILITGTGTGLVTSNTVHSLSSSGTNTTLTDCGLTILGIQYRATGANGNIGNNVIYNISASSTSTVATNSSGIGITNASSPVVDNNRIYAIKNSSTEVTNTPTAAGIIIYNPSGTALVKNNQISLGESGATNQYVGIWMNYETSAYTGNIYYNSVYFGSTNGTNSKNDYCFLRGTNSGSVTTPVNLYNNILFNERTSATAVKHYAIGNNARNEINWTSNYNLLVTPNADVVALWNITDYNLSSLRAYSDVRSYYMTSGGTLTSSGLFNSASTGDLTIKSDNTAAWYVHGKGIAITGLSDDYNGTTRSTTRAGGSTDIGSDELSSVSSTPGDCNVTGSYSINGYLSISYANRQLAGIKWKSQGTPPTAINCKYYSGEAAPDVTSGDKSDGYWVITPTGGSGYKYNITFFLDPAIYYEITDDNNVRLSKNSGSGYEAYIVIVSGEGLDGESNLALNDSLTCYGLTSFSNYTYTSSNNPNPVTLSAFTHNLKERDVKLTWMTTYEYNNKGFHIERKISGTSEWSSIGFVKGNGNSTSATTYNFDDRKLNSGKYNYRLKQVDYNGAHKYFDLSGEIEIGIPKKYNISQNYPNPFNPITKIDYDIPFDSKVSLKIYDLTGKEIKTALNNTLTSGYYTLTLDFTGIASGVYFYRIIAESPGETYTMTKKLVLLK